MMVLLEVGRGPQGSGCQEQYTVVPHPAGNRQRTDAKKENEPAEKASRHRKEKEEAYRRADLSNDALEPTWFQRDDFE